MKILWVTSSGWKEGGAENLLVMIRPILEKRGHVVRVLSSDDRPDMPHFSDDEFPAHHGLLRPIFHAFNPQAYWKMKNVLKTFQPDVVHVHTIGHASPAILFPLKKYPTLLTVHGPEGFIKSLLAWCFPDSYFRHGEHDMNDLRFAGKLRRMYHHIIMDPLYAFGFRNIDTIIAPSTYIQRLLKNEGRESVLLPNGVELFPYGPLQQDKLTQTIVYAGRLEKYKGVEYLLRALPNVLERFPHTTLLVAGQGKDTTSLQELARTLGIERAVTWCGYIDRQALVKLYEKANVVVMPSTGVEAFGLIGIEAMSVGRPVIATDVGGIPDWLVDNVTGFLVPPKDSAALSHAIIRLFSDASMLLEMGRQARLRAEMFDVERHVEGLLAIYETCRNASSRGN